MSDSMEDISMRLKNDFSAEMFDRFSTLREKRILTDTVITSSDKKRYFILNHKKMNLEE